MEADWESKHFTIP